MRRWIAGFCLAVGIAWAAPSAAQGEADFGKLFPSIVRVAGLSEEGVPSFGSGVVIARSDTGSYVVTNYHVIADATAAGIRVVAPDPEGKGGRPIISPARYVGGDSATDIAVLYVHNFFAPPVPLAVGATPENLPIRALGYPGTDMFQWRVLKATPAITDGIVSTFETAPWRPGLSAVGQVQHTADLNPGMSGGPLMDLCGRVLAINTAFISGARGTNLSLAAADVTPYLQRLNLNFKTTRDGCDPAAARRAAEAAEKARAEAAKAAADKQAAAERNKMMQALGAGAVVLALGLGGFAVMRSRKGSAAKPLEATAAPPQGLILKGVGEAAGKTLVIRGDDMANQIGFEIGHTATFGSPATSRRHARMIWAAGQGHVLRDLGSMNGTRVNGREIKGANDQPINLGDIIEFGAPDARYSVEKL